MAAIHALSAYGDSDSDENESVEEEITPDHTAHLNSDVSISKLQSKIQLKSAPEVTAKVDRTSSKISLHWTLATVASVVYRFYEQPALITKLYLISSDYVQFNFFFQHAM